MFELKRKHKLPQSTVLRKCQILTIKKKFRYVFQFLKSKFNCIEEFQRSFVKKNFRQKSSFFNVLELLFSIFSVSSKFFQHFALKVQQSTITQQLWYRTQVPILKSSIKNEKLFYVANTLFDDGFLLLKTNTDHCISISSRRLFKKSRDARQAMKLMVSSIRQLSRDAINKKLSELKR